MLAFRQPCFVIVDLFLQVMTILVVLFQLQLKQVPLDVHHQLLGILVASAVVLVFAFVLGELGDESGVVFRVLLSFGRRRGFVLGYNFAIGMFIRDRVLVLNLDYQTSL